MAILTTEQLRQEYAPAATPKGDLFLAAYRALDDVFRAWHFDAGQGDTGAYNPRRITGGTGWSLHAYGPGDRFTFWWGSTVTTALAVDVDWDNNPYGPVLHTNMPADMIAAVKAIRTNSGAQVWGWGGDYRGNKDAMHFEIVCRKVDLLTGIAGGPIPSMLPEPEDDMIVRNQDNGDIWAVSATHMHHLTGPEWTQRNGVEHPKVTDVHPLTIWSYALSGRVTL